MIINQFYSCRDYRDTDEHKMMATMPKDVRPNKSRARRTVANMAQNYSPNQAAPQLLSKFSVYLKRNNHSLVRVGYVLPDKGFTVLANRKPQECFVAMPQILA